jgi:hypothetical protein
MQRSSSLPAARAHADHFDGLAFDSKADIAGALIIASLIAFLLKLDGGVAVAANQELALMRCSGWLQPTKAFSDAMRCTRPFSSRKSSAR